MADEDKKGKAESASTPSKPDAPKKAAVKKKVAKKKAAKKKVAKKKKAAAATPASATRSEKAEQQVKVSEESRDTGGKREASVSKAKPATVAVAPATGGQSRKFDFILALLLIVFLVASIIILRDEKAREGTAQQQQGILQTIKDALGNMKADTASLFQWEKESVPPVVTPGVTKDALAPATLGPAGNEAAAVEAAPQVTPQYRAGPEQQPRVSDAQVAASVTSTVSKPPADATPVTEPQVNVAPVNEPQVNVPPVAEPAVVIPAETEVPVAQVPESAQPQVEALEEPAQAVVAEPATDQPVAAPPPTRPGYNPYSRHPYGYPRGYGRDYDRSYDWGYDRSYPRRPPQRWSW